MLIFGLSARLAPGICEILISIASLGCITKIIGGCKRVIGLSYLTRIRTLTCLVLFTEKLKFPIFITFFLFLRWDSFWCL